MTKRSDSCASPLLANVGLSFWQLPHQSVCTTNIIGMPDCFLTTNPFVFLTNVILPNNTFAQPFAIPNNPALQNSQLVFQAAPLTAGYNPASLLLSNGICTRIGL